MHITDITSYDFYLINDIAIAPIDIQSIMHNNTIDAFQSGPIVHKGYFPIKQKGMCLPKFLFIFPF